MHSNASTLICIFLSVKSPHALQLHACVYFSPSVCKKGFMGLYVCVLVGECVFVRFCTSLSIGLFVYLLPSFIHSTVHVCFVHQLRRCFFSFLSFSRLLRNINSPISHHV